MTDTASNARLEMFSDGVFAIALTLLVIDIKVPPSSTIGSTRDLWFALGHLWPAIFAFVLSFAIIFITWVNHHRFLRLVHRSSALFVLANGILLLTVVFMPFPTALLGEYLLTDHAAPAVVIYSAVNAAQAAGWILTTGAARRLADDEQSAVLVRESHRNAYFALATYSLLALIAVWYPLTIAVVTTLLWVYWAVFGSRATSQSSFSAPS